MPRKRSTLRKEERIVIDAGRGLEFTSEEELYRHFYNEITHLEEEFFRLRPADDIPDANFGKYETNLNALLDDPDEVWQDSDTVKGTDLAIYIRKFKSREPLFHVAVVYLTEDVPSFVYLHFPTKVESLVDQYRRGRKVMDRSQVDAKRGAIEGDALHEGDEFALGLYTAMMKLRTENDIGESDFQDFVDCREDTIENPDEIWRSNDTMGNVLVTFVKQYSEDPDDSFHYIVVTLEDSASSSHALLFSFPTKDDNLVARDRHGENLQAEEVVQEASH